MGHEYPPQLRKAISRRRPARSTVDGVIGWDVQQFGQKYDDLTLGGATGCTDTCLQWLVFLWTGRKPTHNSIRRAAGLTRAVNRGLYASEVRRVIDYYNLPYTVKYNLTVNQLIEYSKKAPVGFGHRYQWWPDWKGYRLGGRAADGRPNGFATPSGKAGHTQSTWDGAHFGLLLGVATHETLKDRVYGWEPNHGSGARPEKPQYDIMTIDQLIEVYNSYRSLGRAPYAVVPTKTLPAKGY